MAEELGELVPHVGGAGEAACLLAPLETLAVTEETVVRDKAAESLRKVASAMDASSVSTHFVPLVKRLAGGEWFTCRVSAAGLFAAAFQALSKAGDTSQSEALQEAFQRLAKDETPMVRTSHFLHNSNLNLSLLSRNQLTYYENMTPCCCCCRRRLGPPCRCTEPCSVCHRGRRGDSRVSHPSHLPRTSWRRPR